LVEDIGVANQSKKLSSRLYLFNLLLEDSEYAKTCKGYSNLDKLIRIKALFRYKNYSTYFIESSACYSGELKIVNNNSRKIMNLMPDIAFGRILLLKDKVKVYGRKYCINLSVFFFYHIFEHLTILTFFLNKCGNGHSSGYINFWQTFLFKNMEKMYEHISQKPY
jgi:hypothetical protein